MKVTITFLGVEPEATFDKGVVEAGPAGTFFRVTQELEERTTSSGLVVSALGSRKHTWVPASTIRRVEVEE